MSDAFAEVNQVLSGVPVWNNEQLAEIVDDDANIFSELVGIYREQGPEDATAVEERFAAGDAVGAADHAHSLKGASANMGAERVREIAALLEMQAKAGHLDYCRDILPALRKELRAVLELFETVTVRDVAS